MPATRTYLLGILRFVFFLYNELSRNGFIVAKSGCSRVIVDRIWNNERQLLSIRFWKWSETYSASLRIFVVFIDIPVSQLYVRALARESHGVATVVQFSLFFWRNLILLSIDFCQEFVFVMLLTWSTFPVAASLLWNSLPSDIQSSSLPVFRQRSITFIFRQSFPDIYSTVTLLRLCGLRNSSCYFSHTKNLIDIDIHWCETWRIRQWYSRS